MRYETSVEIEATPELIWPVLIDVERWPEWTPSMRRVERVDEGEFGVDSRVRIKQPRLPAVIWRVTAFEPGRSFSWIARGAGMTTVADHRLAAGPTGATVVTLSIHQSGPLAPVLALFTERLTKRYVLMEAGGLKARSEAR